MRSYERFERWRRQRRPSRWPLTFAHAGDIALDPAETSCIP